MWEYLPRYGFGRYDVQKPKPVERAMYIARYVSKLQNGLASRVRSWGTVGFVRVTSRNVLRGSLCLTRVTEVPAWLVSQLRRVELDESFPRRKEFIENRFCETLDIETKMQNAIPASANSEIASEASDGSYSIVVGEYRGFKLRDSKKKDRLSGVERSTTTIEHVVIAGTNRVVVSEFLAGGSDGKSVSPAAEIGAQVLVKCAKAEWFPMKNEPQARGFIKPLAVVKAK